MTLAVDAQTTLETINQTFKSQYPHLSLHFFADSHSGSNQHDLNHSIDTHQPLGKLTNKRMDNIVIELHFWQTTADAERMLISKLGIHAAIYRRHDQDWIQTVGSDGLTLEQQNELGAQSVKENDPLYMREKPL